MRVLLSGLHDVPVHDGHSDGLDDLLLAVAGEADTVGSQGQGHEDAHHRRQDGTSRVTASKNAGSCVALQCVHIV